MSLAPHLYVQILFPILNSIMSIPDVDQSRRNPKPRLLLESERARLEEFIESIGYSARQDILQFELLEVRF